MQAVDRQRLTPPDAVAPLAAAKVGGRSELLARRTAILNRLTGLSRAPGLLAALMTAGIAGLADGLLTVVRAPEDSRGIARAIALVFHCVAVTVLLGSFIGLVQEVLLRAFRRIELVHATRVFLSAGPRAWFATNRVLSERVFARVFGSLLAAVLLLDLFDRATLRIRDPLLLAFALVGLTLAVLVGAALSAVLVTQPTTWVLRRVPALANPAAAGGAAVLFLALPMWLEVRTYLPAVKVVAELGWTLFAVFAAGVDVAILLVIRRSRWFRARSPEITALGVALALALATLSGTTLGRDQAVLSTVLLRSALTRHVVGPLQKVIDRDGDGFGAWFGGGDCDDGDAQRHPGRSDVPGNGVDENCSGADAAFSEKTSIVSGTRWPAPTALRTSVLFVSIDAMRHDHMSVYGYRRPTTPNLARFAERALRFTEAYTTSPQSVRSLASVFTGRHAVDLSWRRDHPFPQLEPRNTTLAEDLRAQGHATAAFLNTSYFSLTAGFFQGFESVHEGALFKDDERPIVARAATWLDERRRSEEPFFAWVHIINPHAPYADRSAPEEFGHEEVDRYDEEIASADAALEALLRALDKLERDGQPVVTVVFSDHGEAFGEHGHVHHADCLHDDVLRVPLLIRAPGAPSGETRALVSLVDLHATVLSFVGLPARDGASRSLAEVVLAPDPCRRRPTCVRETLRAEVVPTYGSSALLRALVSPPWKLIHDVEHGSWELYDRSRDPRERNNVYGASIARAGSLRARLLDSTD